MRVQAQRRRRRRARVAILAAVSAAAGGIASTAGAATKTYTGNTGLWSAAGNWTPAGLPVAADTVILQPSFSPGVTVTYDGSVLAANTAVTSLTINSTSASSVSLLQSTNILSISEAGLVLLRHRRNRRTEQLERALSSGFTRQELDQLAAAAPLLERLADSI